MYKKNDEKYPSVAKPLYEYLCSGLYTLEMHKVVSNCKHTDVNNFMNFLKMSVPTKLSVNKYINNDLQSSKIQNNNMSVIVTDNDIIMYVYDLDSFHKLINNDMCIVAKPIYANVRGSLHLLMLIINKVTNDIIVFDSANNMFVNDIELVIKKNIQNYNIFHNTNYIVVPNKLWNSNNLVLNKEFLLSPIYHGGFCVIYSILFVHYMITTKKDVNQCLKIFNNFDNSQMILLLNDYSIFYYLFTVV